MNQTVKGYLFAVLSAVIYGCMPLMAKHIYADGVNPLTLVFLRNLFSLIPLGLLALREGRSPPSSARWSLLRAPSSAFSYFTSPSVSA